MGTKYRTRFTGEGIGFLYKYFILQKARPSAPRMHVRDDMKKGFEREIVQSKFTNGIFKGGFLKDVK